MHPALVVLVSVSVVGIAVYYGLPAVIRALGFHPHYDVPKFKLGGKRALLISTSHGVLGETGRKTGLMPSELTVPYYAFLDSGLEVDIASPKGGAVPIEPFTMGWPIATPEDTRFKNDKAAMGKLLNSLKISEVDPDRYDVVFLAGGWGAAYDLGQSEEVGEVITKANANDAIVGGVCHGPLGLIQAKDKDGSPLVKGRRITAVSDLQVEQFGIKITPLHPESELRKLGAEYEKQTAVRDYFATHVVVDGNIVTGQNQNSGGEAAHRVLEILDGSK